MKINKLQIFEYKDDKYFTKKIVFDNESKIFTSEDSSFGKSIIIESILFSLGATREIYSKNKNYENFSVIMEFTHENNKYMIKRFNDAYFIYENEKILDIAKESLFNHLFKKAIQYRISGGKNVPMNFSYLYSSLFIPQERMGTPLDKRLVMRPKNVKSKDHDEPRSLLLINESKQKERILEEQIESLKSQISVIKKSGLINESDIKVLSKENDIDRSKYKMLLSKKEAYSKAMARKHRLARGYLRNEYKITSQLKEEEELINSLEAITIEKSGIEISLKDFYEIYSVNKKIDYKKALEYSVKYKKEMTEIGNMEKKLDELDRIIDNKIETIGKYVAINQLAKIASDKTKLKDIDFDKMNVELDKLKTEYNSVREDNEKRLTSLAYNIEEKLKINGITNTAAEGNSTAFLLRYIYEIIKNSNLELPIIYDDIGHGNPNKDAIQESINLIKKSNLQLITTLNTAENTYDNINEKKLTKRDNLIDNEISSDKYLKLFMID